MLCVKCRVDYQCRSREDMPEAVLVFDGLSLCLWHFNTHRGHAGNFDRYPEEENAPFFRVDEDGVQWSECQECRLPIFWMNPWSPDATLAPGSWNHQGGTPPQDHEAKPG